MRTELSDFVVSKISPILKSDDESYVRASLAKLRRGIGKHPGRTPDIGEFILWKMPEKFRSTTDGPTEAEWAVHIAMTLFALHQQGKDPQDNPMSVIGKPLGWAVRMLVVRQGKQAEQPIKRRFDTVVTSDSIEELAHHLRGIIQLLRSKGIPLDYPQLAEDLYQFQNPEYRDNMRLRWLRDYYRIGKDEENDEQ